MLTSIVTAKGKNNKTRYTAISSKGVHDAASYGSTKKRKDETTKQRPLTVDILQLRRHVHQQRRVLLRVEVLDALRQSPEEATGHLLRLLDNKHHQSHERDTDVIGARGWGRGRGAGGYSWSRLPTYGTVDIDC